MAVLIGAGAALRLWQYAGNPALWMDELAVAHISPPVRSPSS
jgi:hypothetical protein